MTSRRAARSAQGRTYTYTPRPEHPNPAGEVEIIERTGPGVVRVRHIDTGLEFGIFRSDLDGDPADDGDIPIAEGYTPQDEAAPQPRRRH